MDSGCFFAVSYCTSVHESGAVVEHWARTRAPRSPHRSRFGVHLGVYGFENASRTVTVPLGASCFTPAPDSRRPTCPLRKFRAQG